MIPHLLHSKTETVFFAIDAIRIMVNPGQKQAMVKKEQEGLQR